MLGLTFRSSTSAAPQAFAPTESRLRAQRLLKRRNYNTAERIRATLRGRTLRKFDAIIMLAVGRYLLYATTKADGPVLRSKRPYAK